MHEHPILACLQSGQDLPPGWESKHAEEKRRDVELVVGGIERNPTLSIVSCHALPAWTIDGGSCILFIKGAERGIFSFSFEGGDFRAGQNRWNFLEGERERGRGKPGTGGNFDPFLPSSSLVFILPRSKSWGRLIARGFLDKNTWKRREKEFKH